MKAWYLISIVILSIGQVLADVSVQSIAFNCHNCHDQQSALPALNSLPASALAGLLLDFKYDRKPATLMPRLVKGYSDAELQAVAEYLGKR